MIICDADIEAMSEFCGAVQIFQDNQIVTRDASCETTALKEDGTQSTLAYLESIIGADVTNRRVQKALHMIHPYMVAAVRSGLGAANE